jgi:hypothetical protein
LSNFRRDDKLNDRATSRNEQAALDRQAERGSGRPPVKTMQEGKK